MANGSCRRLPRPLLISTQLQLHLKTQPGHKSKRLGTETMPINGAAAGVEEVIKIVLRKQTFLYISVRFVSFSFFQPLWPQQWQHAGSSKSPENCKVSQVGGGNNAPHIIYFNRVERSGLVGKCVPTVPSRLATLDPSPKAPY